jgi:hypothetical protein
VWGVPLAKRGWEVTGISVVETALRRARERVTMRAWRCASSVVMHRAREAHPDALAKGLTCDERFHRLRLN